MTEHQNGIVWYELMTTDQDAAGRFYADVLEWSVDQGSDAPKGYRMIAGPGGLVGGSMALPPGALAMGMKPNWVFYVSVPDADAAAAAVAVAGGAIHMPGTDVPGAGRFAFVADPQGANFYVMKTIGAGPAASHAEHGEVQHRRARGRGGGVRPGDSGRFGDGSVPQRRGSPMVDPVRVPLFYLIFDFFRA
jgi:predicted enzyme related to lactoylglutathione lyase